MGWLHEMVAMLGIPFEYEMKPTTWVYLSSLLIIGIYFKFRRFWSLRNLDLIGLICYAPGLLLVAYQQERLGYVWLFSVGGFFLVRLLIDPVLVRRPLLEPNLSAGGLVFTCVALLAFLAASVVTQQGGFQGDTARTAVVGHGSRCPLFLVMAGVSDKALATADPGSVDSASADAAKRKRVEEATTRTTAILAHLAIVIALVLIGYRHFDNIQSGIATATLYLLVPYTSQWTSEVDHVVPGAMLVWAVQCYRRPVFSGMLTGLAIGAIYYPAFLLPFWCAFYWRRGLFRFGFGLAATLGILALAVTLTPSGWELFAQQFRDLIGNAPDGFWKHHVQEYRIPVFVAFGVLCGSLALWPAQKNLGTLLSCSAAVMLGTQFWHAPQGGLYLAWYLPLLLLTIFRPNLEDRVALTAVSSGWKLWRKSRASAAEPAA